MSKGLFDSSDIFGIAVSYIFANLAAISRFFDAVAAKPGAAKPGAGRAILQFGILCTSCELKTRVRLSRTNCKIARPAPSKRLPGIFTLSSSEVLISVAAKTR